MRNLYLIIEALVYLILLQASCNQKVTDEIRENKDMYNIKVGEIVEIYGITNSCCCYTLCNESDLKHTKYIASETIMKDPDCMGCSYTVVKKFKAKSRGMDTVFLATTIACKDCGINENEKTEKYIINVQ